MRARQLTVAAALAIVVAAASAADAEPYLTVRTGAKCSDCHTNLTGGGKRTAFPRIHANEVLRDLEILPIPARAKAFDGQILSQLSIGADFRFRNTITFFDDPSSRGRVPENRAFRTGRTVNDADVEEFLLYLQVDLLPDVLTLYVDEDFSGGATNREVFGLLRGVLPWDGYVKAGRLYPAFGLRVHDDEAYIRARSGFTFQNSDEGVELGIAPGPFFVATSITDGEEGNTDVQATVNGYTVLDDLPVVRAVLLGASFARQASDRWAAGWYAGANLWRFTGLAEFDLIDDRTDTVAARDHWASYAELNFLAFTWLNFRGTFEFVRAKGDADQTRYAVGVEPFIDKVMQPRIQYRINNGPGARPELNTAELLFELHLFF
jgi:hypothetical protein